MDFRRAAKGVNMLSSLFKQFENIVVLDVETTGLDPKTEEIIELGAILVTAEEKPYSIKDELAALITLSEGKKLSSEVSALTGISEKQLKSDGQPKEKVSEKLAKLLKHPNTLLVAYNAQFDLNFIYHFMNKFNHASALKQIKMLDAMAVYKDRRDYPHKLSDAVEKYNLQNENAHRAVDDAKATLGILNAMGAEKDDLYRYVNLFGYNPKYGVSGSKISSVKYKPQGYDRKKPLYEI